MTKLTTNRLRPLVLIFATVLSLSACGDSSATETNASVETTVSTETTVPSDAVPEPVVVAQDEPIDPMWAELTANAVSLESAAFPPLAGLEVFNEVFVLPDNRFLLRGRWDGDDPIEAWFQQNPGAVPDGSVALRTIWPTSSTPCNFRGNPARL